MIKEEFIEFATHQTMDSLQRYSGVMHIMVIKSMLETAYMMGELSAQKPVDDNK